jgi:hypothetical protein
VDVQQKESTEGEINGFRKEEVFDCLCEGDDLCVRSGGFCHRISSSWVDVDRVKASRSPNEVAELDGHIASTGTDVNAPPPLTDAEALERGLEGASIDIVAQSSQSTVKLACHGPTLSHRPRDLTAEPAPCPQPGHLLGSCG